MINVGPTKEGQIVPLYEERLRQLGTWLSVNGEAIYASRPWTHQNDTQNPDVWYCILIKVKTSFKVSITSKNFQVHIK